jgi:HK97 family phage major capsid protein
MKTLFAQQQNRLRIQAAGLNSIAMPRSCCADSQTKWEGPIAFLRASDWTHRRALFALLKTSLACARAAINHSPEHRIIQIPTMKNLKRLLKPYRQLSYLLSVIILSLALFALHIIPAGGILFIVGCWQLLAFARSRRCGVCFTTVLSPEQIDEFQDILKQAQAEFPRLKGFTERLAQVEKTNDELRGQINRMKKTGLGMSSTGVRWIGGVPFVSDDCAKALTSVFVLDCSRIKGALESMLPDESARERIVGYARGVLGIETRAGGTLSTSDIPLPTIYVPQVIELVFAYGQARKFATIFPLGAGTVKLPRLKAGEDAFGYLGAGTAGMSQSVPEKEVTAELVTFTANKAGGLIRIPTELEEDTFIPIGQFLARYIARQFAKLEDSTLFLADGTASYASITGVGPYCSANPTYLQQLAAGKTKPTDATINDFRAMRGKVSPAVLFNMAANGRTAAAYYMSPTMEALLVTFNTIGQPLIYRPQQGDQPATLDGFPIHWIGVSQPYATIAAPSAFLAFFGDLTYWYLGERGAPRVEVSREVFFATDELAMRALERIDVEAMAIDAMAALQTAAA